MNFTDYRKQHDAIRSETGKYAREELLAQLLLTANNDAERKAINALLLANFGSPQESLTTGIQARYIAKTIGSVKTSMDDIKDAFAATCKNISNKQITITDVYDKMRSYCLQEKRTDKVKKELITYFQTHCDAPEGRLAAELMCGKINNLTDAIQIVYASGRAWHTKKWDNAQRKKIKPAFNLLPDSEQWITRLKTMSLADAADLKPMPGQPLNPQLADRVKTLEDVFVLQANGSFLEPKLDGERIHAHKTANGEYFLYTRQLKNVTNHYPEIITSLKKLPHTSFILDGELVAIDENDKILPFNMLQQRFGRKEKLDQMSQSVRTGIVFYDILDLDGKDFMDVTYKDRSTKLRTIIDSDQWDNLFTITQTKVDKPSELLAAVEAAYDEGAEGIMVKAMDSLPEPGERRKAWFKIKPDYLEGFGDTLDLVILGWYEGSGKRHGVMGALLLGCYNEDTGNIEALSKIGTGFSDKQLAEWTVKLQKETTPSKPLNVIATNEIPDHWVNPNLIIEIETAEISKSPKYDAGRTIMKDSGISLRFPRYKKQRPDKTYRDATTTQAIYKQLR